MAHFKELKKEAVEEHLRSRNDCPSEEDIKRKNSFLTHTQTDTHMYILTDYLGQQPRLT